MNVPRAALPTPKLTLSTFAIGIRLADLFFANPQAFPYQRHSTIAFNLIPLTSFGDDLRPTDIAARANDQIKAGAIAYFHECFANAQTQPGGYSALGWAVLTAACAGLDLSDSGTGWETLGVPREKFAHIAKTTILTSLKNNAERFLENPVIQDFHDNAYAWLDRYNAIDHEKRTIYDFLETTKDAADTRALTQTLKKHPFPQMINTACKHLGASLASCRKAFAALSVQERTKAFQNFQEHGNDGLFRISQVLAQATSADWTGRGFAGFTPPVFVYRVS